MLKQTLGKILLLLAASGCSLVICFAVRAEDTAAPRTEAIIGGTIGSASLFPAVAEIYVDGGICTGTLIDPEYVLTAGHCAFDDRGRMVKDMNEVTVLLGNEIRGAQSLHVHPLYDNQADACSEGIPDASLIHLDSPVNSIAPIAVSNTPPAVGTQLLLVGYGMLGTGPIGQNGQFPADGSLAYGYTTVDQVSSTFVFWKYKSSRGGSNTAGGDSGGPAFQTVNNQLVLQAITCGGTGNAQYGTESLDTRADILIDWLSQFIVSISSTSPPSLNVPSIIPVRAQRKINYPIVTVGAKPTALQVIGLPPELSLRDGAIQGVPATAGAWPIIIQAENEYGTSTYESTLLVRPPDTIFKISRATLQYNQSQFSKNLLLLKGKIIAHQSRLLRNRSFTVQIGNYHRTFVLGLNRRSYSRADDRLRVNSIKQLHGSSRSSVEFNVTLGNPSAFSEFATLGFTDSSLTTFGQRLTLPITLQFDQNQATIQQVLSLNSADLRWHMVP